MLSSVQAPALQPGAWPPLSRGRCSAPEGILDAGLLWCFVAQSAEGRRSGKGRLWGKTPFQWHPGAGQEHHVASCPTWWCTEPVCCCCCPSTLWRSAGGLAPQRVSLAAGPCRWSKAWKPRPEAVVLACTYTSPWSILDRSCTDLMRGKGCGTGSPGLWGRNPLGGENLFCLPILPPSHQSVSEITYERAENHFCRTRKPKILTHPKCRQFMYYTGILGPLVSILTFWLRLFCFAMFTRSLYKAWTCILSSISFLFSAFHTQFFRYLYTHRKSHKKKSQFQVN